MSAVDEFLWCPAARHARGEEERGALVGKREAVTGGRYVFVGRNIAREVGGHNCITSGCL